MSTTPRTDDAKEQYLTSKIGIYGVLDEARKLETELAHLNAEVERLRHLEAVLRSSAADMTAGNITAGGVAELRAEVEELKAAGGPPFIRSKAIQNLREEVARLNNLLLQADELNEGALFKISETIARAEKAEFDLAHARVMVRVLRDALEGLRDEQNGAPYCTREEKWKKAMDRADAALAQTKEASK